MGSGFSVKYLQGFFDKEEEVSDISKLGDMLKQYGPTDARVTGFAESFQGVKVLVIRNLCEAEAVSYLVAKYGWDGAVVLVLAGGADPYDFKSAANVIRCAGVAKFKMVFDVIDFMDRAREAGREILEPGRILYLIGANV